MRSPKNVFLNIERDPKDRFHYSVTDLLHSETKDLGSYGLNRLIDELGELKEVVGYDHVMIFGIKIDKSVTNNEDIYFRSLDGAISYFESIEESF